MIPNGGRKFAENLMPMLFNPSLRSWVDYPTDSEFPIQNIPFGIASLPTVSNRFAASRIGEFVINLDMLQSLGAFAGIELPSNIFKQDVLNPFISLGKQVTSSVRERLITLLATDTSDDTLKQQSNKWLHPIAQSQQHLPVAIGDYTDFYSSIEHATNVGIMFRDAQNPLLPNWKHLPVGYHGRASSISASGHSFNRPKGQTKPDDGPPILEASRQLDFELEMGFIIGKEIAMGDHVTTADAENYIFGLVLFNDWSARDIQRWEYVPLGPFLGKNFASTASPWIVTLEALEPFRIHGPEQEPGVLPYLAFTGARNYDIQLSVSIQPSGSNPTVVSKSNFRYMYWNMCQQLAHHTINGCNIRVGDLYASGTISGPTEDSYGSMLELSWKGTRSLTLSDGSTRKFIEDGDRVILEGFGEQEGIRIGFGPCAAIVLPVKE